MTYQTELGQTLDLITAPEGSVDFSNFTMERWEVVPAWVSQVLHKANRGNPFACFSHSEALTQQQRQKREGVKGLR